MHTLTVKIAAADTLYVYKEREEDGSIRTKESAYGHMWFSLDGQSYGFASSEENLFPFIGDGKKTDWDDDGYKWTYYTGQIIITEDQNAKLLDFWNNPNKYGFDIDYYNGLTNSCIDFVWKALNVAGFNPSDFDGNFLPASNADDADVALYKYLFGDTINWDSSAANEGYYDVIYGSKDNDVLSGDGTIDAIYGGAGNDQISCGSGDDKLYGGTGDDTISGGAGKDLLVGDNGYDRSEGSDTLQGGEDFDTYIAGDNDIIMDEDGKGEVYFDKTLLTGGKKEAGSGCEPTEDDGSSVYKGNGGTYTLSGDTLTFERGGETLTILNFSSGKLGITLEDSSGGGNDCPPPGGEPGGGLGGGLGGGEEHCPSPINPLFHFHFHLPYTSGTGGGGGGGLGGGGGGGGCCSSGISCTCTPHYTPTPPIPIVKCLNLPNYSSAGAGGGGGSTGPIVLDLNHDGITSISIAASIALFDYDGDGIKENTAWIQSTDALLVNDVNNDGLINDASELFGNYTRNSDGSIAKGGYQALSYYDSNKDNIIDANDERFGELKVWVDSDGDGITDDGELKTLSELGITSLSINTSTPYMATTEETNTIIQETTFTDAQGEGIMRDVLFRYENNSEPEDGVYFDMDGNGIKEKMTTWTDPNQWMVVRDINGDGKITSGREVVGNHMVLNDERMVA